MSREEIRANLAGWEADSAEYQQRHGSQLGTWDRPLGWGTFSISEEEVRALGDVHGMDALEFGCGAAQFGIKVAMRGARVIGLDFSANQLTAAAPNMVDSGVRFPLVRGDAERLPFAASSFDLVFCDHGAMAFADPLVTVPEIARVLRPGGSLIFSMSTPFICVTWPPLEGPPGRELVRPYHGMHELMWDKTDGTVEYQLPYGGWIRLFRANRFTIEDLIELRPGPNPATTYLDYVTVDWARDFPAEHIWKVRKEPA
jgi:SAM-dependent methyltransferase